MTPRKLSIVVIGNEILLGQVTDTNSGAISRAFAPFGWKTESIFVVGDNASDIKNALEDAMRRSELVITTGGLGPTKDDITKGVMLDIFGGELVYDESVAENIRRVFELRHLDLNRLTREQALVPSSCMVIQNRLGTAPIMWFEKGPKVVVNMPGVPFETEGMLPEVMKAANGYFAPGQAIWHQNLMISGVTESALAQRLENYEDSLPAGLSLAYLPSPGLIKLRLDGQCPQDIFKSSLQKLKSEIADVLIYEGEASAAHILLHTLKEKGHTLATAESCTGGNISHQITLVPGASDHFLGGVVSYANSVKTGILGVNSQDIELHGAVSRQVVEQMASGAARITGADCAIATSGIAGPEGGSDLKPVGTVWMAFKTPTGILSKCFHFPGDRRRVIERASTEALLELNKILNHE